MLRLTRLLGKPEKASMVAGSGRFKAKSGKGVYPRQLPWHGRGQGFASPQVHPDNRETAERPFSMHGVRLGLVADVAWITAGHGTGCTRVFLPGETLDLLSIALSA